MKKTLFITLFVFLFLPFYSFADDAKGRLDAASALAVDKAAQLFRKFDSVAFTYKTEISYDDGKTWEAVRHTNVVVDERVGIRLTKILIHPGTSQDINAYFIKELIKDGKLLTLKHTFKNDIKYTNAGNFSWDIKDKPRYSNATISKITVGGFPLLFDGIDFPGKDNLLSPNLQAHLFNDSEGKAILEIKEKGGPGQSALWFDAKTGGMLQYRFLFSNGTHYVKTTFSEHQNINGWNIPLVKVEKMRMVLLGATTPRNTLTRDTIEKDSVLINSLPERNASYYSFELPVGTSVSDTIKGITYKYEGIHDDLNKEAVSQELDKMLEEGQKLKGAAQKGQTTEKK
jgi:outer membrane lipoprotein-sorting protein